jgi:[acyl-carrier-protein] S-malonyltransferase
MYALTGQAPAAAELFEHATKWLGTDPRALVQSVTGDALYENRTGQILCALQALAAGELLHTHLSNGFIVAGYSVGEVAAWGVAGLIEPADVLDLIVTRAAAMDAASQPGDGLLFIRGLSRQSVDRLCERYAVDIAIVNPGEAFVLGGSQDGLNAATQDAKQNGAERIIRLGVSVASHTRGLTSASMAFRDALSNLRLAARLPARIRLISGIDAAAVLDVTKGLDKLAAQISQTIHWADCLAACVEAGASVFLELGPGRALAEMAAAAYPQIPARSLDDFKTIDGLQNWLSRQQSA